MTRKHELTRWRVYTRNTGQCCAARIIKLGSQGPNHVLHRFQQGCSGITESIGGNGGRGLGGLSHQIRLKPPPPKKCDGTVKNVYSKYKLAPPHRKKNSDKFPLITVSIDRGVLTPLSPQNEFTTQATNLVDIFVRLFLYVFASKQWRH